MWPNADKPKHCGNKVSNVIWQTWFEADRYLAARLLSPDIGLVNFYFEVSIDLGSHYKN